jgi:hypothetical protein
LRLRVHSSIPTTPIGDRERCAGQTSIGTSAIDDDLDLGIVVESFRERGVEPRVLS